MPKVAERRALTNAHSVELLDLAHRLDLEDGEWLRAVAFAIAKAVGAPAWTAAMGRFVPAVALTASADHDGGKLTEAWRLVRMFDARSNLFLAQRGPAFAWPSLEEARAAVGDDQADLMERARLATGFARFHCWAVLDPSGAGAGFDCDLPPSSAGLRSAVTSVMLHVGAAARLRLALDGAGGEAEAVLSADGARVLHAEGAALTAENRDALRHAVVAIDRAKTHRKSALDQLVAREVLVRGRWFLVDEHERGGQRHVVARVNEPTPPERVLPELTTREEQVALYLALGHSAKQIAYDLGLSPATVSRDLGRIRAALGARSNAASVAEVTRRLRRALGILMRDRSRERNDHGAGRESQVPGGDQSLAVTPRHVVCEVSPVLMPKAATRAALTLELLDLTHRLDVEDGEWLRGVGTMVAKLLGAPRWTAGMGRFVPAVTLTAREGYDEDALADGWRVAASLGVLSNLFFAQRGPDFAWPSIEEARRAVGADQAELIERVRVAAGFARVHCWAVLDPSGAGAVFTCDLPPSAVSLRPVVTSVMQHVGAAARLRLALDDAGGLTEAVISADGARVLHAEGAALSAENRDALRRAVVAIERAKTHRKSALDQLVAREVLVRGRWFLVDEHERGGQRHVVARVNEPTPPERLLTELTAREEQVAIYLTLGHTAKQIAYDLGLSAATVSRDLGRIRAAFGVASNAASVAEVTRRLRRALGR